MIALAWSFFVVISMVVASSQAFHTGPTQTGLGLTTTSSTTTAGPTPSTTTTATSTATAGSLFDRRIKPLAGDKAGLIGAPAALPIDQNEDEDNVDNSAEDEDDDNAEEYAMRAAASLPGQPPRRANGEQTVYVIEFETEPEGAKSEGSRNRGGKGMGDDGSEGQSPLDPWSIVWYIGSFGGLVAFFVIVSCSEWCCRRGARPLSVPYTQRGEVINAQPASESPPPPYHLFAPPPYDSVNYAEVADKSGEKLDIYVITVPIHQPTQQLQSAGQQQQQPQPA